MMRETSEESSFTTLWSWNPHSTE